MESAFDTLAEETLYEIRRNVTRLLDSILMGDVSAKSITSDRLYTSTLKEIAQYTNSEIMTNKFFGFTESYVHRQLNNMKSDLIKEGSLEENCT